MDKIEKSIMAMMMVVIMAAIMLQVVQGTEPPMETLSIDITWDPGEGE